MATGRSFWTVLTGLWIKLWLPVEQAATKGDERGVKPGIREARHSLELTGRITGELRENNRDGTSDTALGAIIKLATALSEAQLRGMAAGEDLRPAIEVEGHVIEPNYLITD